jgi:hypothetical protein
MLRCSVSSLISCIVIKSDFLPKRIPTTGEVVRVAGERGSFVVMQVDRDRRVVELMERSGQHRLLDVPFTSVRIFNRQLAHAIHRFLDARDEAKADELESQQR